MTVVRSPESVLLVATRQIGDVLLTTPLLRSLRRAWPQARIDALVYTGKGGMLEGNPDCNDVIESDEHPDVAGYRRLMNRIGRRYELALTTQANDRAHVYAWMAARRRFGVVPDRRFQSLWKRLSCAASTPLDNIHTHTVIQNLRVADLLGITRDYTVVPPRASPPSEKDGTLSTPDAGHYAVLHPFPMWRYKRWTHDGWLGLIDALRARGLRVVLTGGPADEERIFCGSLANGREGVTSITGERSFGQLTSLLQGAACFVGPDTSVTHLAAACGTPTVALYGPTNPVKWGPWPAGFAEDRNPYINKALLQQVNNVWLVQPEGDCVPCHGEGCDKHKNSVSECLLSLPSSIVVDATNQALAWGAQRANADPHSHH